MDKGVIALLIPLMALAIPVAAVVFSGMQKMAKLRIEEAKARMGEGGGDVQALAQDVDQLRHELAEVQERLDFTERLLSQKTPQPLPPSL
ncbi:MAG: hypothetical protein ACHQXA_05415 [Gemmatimonadales bacterium]